MTDVECVGIGKHHDTPGPKNVRLFFPPPAAIQGAFYDSPQDTKRAATAPAGDGAIMVMTGSGGLDRANSMRADTKLGFAKKVEDIFARERQLRKQVEAWQLEKQALQQEHTRMVTDLAAVDMVAPKRISINLVVPLLLTLLIFPAPYYITYRAVTYTVVVMTVLAFIGILGWALRHPVRTTPTAGTEFPYSGMNGCGIVAREPVEQNTVAMSCQTVLQEADKMEIELNCIWQTGTDGIDGYCEHKVNDVTARVRQLQKHAKGWVVEHQDLQYANYLVKDELLRAVGNSSLSHALMAFPGVWVALSFIAVSTLKHDFIITLFSTVVASVATFVICFENIDDRMYVYRECSKRLAERQAKNADTKLHLENLV